MNMSTTREKTGVETGHKSHRLRAINSIVFLYSKGQDSYVNYTRMKPSRPVRVSI